MKTYCLVILICFAFTNSQWTNCADEGQKCEVSGIKIVRFGEGVLYSFTEMTDSVICDKTSFIHPSPNNRKQCDYTDSNFVKCADEGLDCSNDSYLPALAKFTDGNKSAFKRISFATTFRCDGQTFDNLISSNVKKICFLSQLPTDGY